MLNNREIAVTLWTVIVVVLALSQLSIRLSLLNVFKALLNRYILVTFGLMFLYITGIIGIIYSLDFWSFSLLKDTIIWIFFGAIPLLFSFVTSNRQGSVFTKIFKDNVRAVIFVEYIVNRPYRD